MDAFDAVEPHRAEAPSDAALLAIGPDLLLTDAEHMSSMLALWRHELHRIPELGLNTPFTTSYVLERLSEAGIAARRGESGEVVVTLGSGEGPCILLRADMDGLPIVERSGEPWASANGCAHACGHDMHAASLLGAAKLLKDREDAIARLGGSVKLLFQPGEETLNGASAVISHGLLNEPQVHAAFALHVNGRCPMGLMIYGADEFAGVWSFRIELHGRGGHGSAPAKCIDPITVGVDVHRAAVDVMAKEAGTNGGAVLSFGKFEAGSAPNVIPDDCVLEGTLRAFDPVLLRGLKARVCDAVETVAAEHGCAVEVLDLSDVPPLNADASMTDSCLSYVGSVLPYLRFRGIQHSLGAEDFAFFSEAVPSAYLTVGAAVRDSEEHFSMHDARIRFDDSALPICAAAYASVALGWIADSVNR